MWRFLISTFTVLALFVAEPAYSQSGNLDSDAARASADLAYRAGIQQYRQRQYDAALRQFERAVTLAPDVESYRRSLLLTRQRIAINKANNNALRENAERTRKALSLQQEESDADLSAARNPVGRPSGGAPNARGSSLDGAIPMEPVYDSLNHDAQMNDVLRPDDIVRDPVRDLNLGGTTNTPLDLPIAGSGFDLPIGRMPPELRQTQAPTVLPNYDTTPEGAPKDDGTTSILHDIDVMQGTIKPDKPPQGPDSPRLDRSDPLP